MAARAAATAMQDLIVTFGWEQFDYPPDSPDLVPSNFQVFLHLKLSLVGRQCHDDNEVKGGIILRCRDTKTGALLQVPQQWWKLSKSSVKYVHQMAI
jgi:hypothetical protein